MALTAKLITDARALEPLRTAWDALAADAGRPYSGPDWMLAWWEHLRPDGAELRTVVVTDGDELVGIAPFCAVGRDYSLLAGQLASNVEPLATAGRERDVAAAIAAALAATDPAPRTLDLHLQGDRPSWPDLLEGGWPGRRRPWRATSTAKTALLVTVDGVDFETWLQSKSSKFRYWVRQGRRKLEAAGAEFALATHDSLERDVADLVRLHHQRRAEIGSDLSRDGSLERMLVAAGGRLLDSDRFRLVSVTIDGKAIAVQLMVAAGGQVAGWNSGFDEAYAKLSPATHAVIHGISVAAELGDRQVDLGPGGQPYKQRLADDERSLTSATAVTPGPGYAATRARLALRGAPAAVGRRLPPGARERIQRMRGR